MGLGFSIEGANTGPGINVPQAEETIPVFDKKRTIVNGLGHLFEKCSSRALQPPTVETSLLLRSVYTQGFTLLNGLAFFGSEIK